MRIWDMILDSEPVAERPVSQDRAPPVRGGAGSLAVKIRNRVKVTHPASWASEGCATPNDPLFIMPGDGLHPRNLTVTILPATVNSGAPEFLRASLRQYVLEWAGLERDAPQTGKCVLGHYATMTFRLPRAGRVLWFQRWHLSDGRILVVATHTSSGIPSSAAIAEMHQIVMDIAPVPATTAVLAEADGRPAEANSVAPARRPWWRGGWFARER